MRQIVQNDDGLPDRCRGGIFLTLRQHNGCPFLPPLPSTNSHVRRSPGDDFMTQAAAIPPKNPTELFCPVPGCGGRVRELSHGLECARCQLRFVHVGFNPLPWRGDAVDAASEEHAICAHHPEHKATAICQGSGNYICPLCAVEIDGKTYSVQFLDSPPGRHIIVQKFNSMIPRPDRMAWRLLIYVLLPPITFVMLYLSFIWIPVAIYYYVKAIRQRRGDILFRRIFTKFKMILMGCGIAAWFVLGILMVASFYWRDVLGH